MRTLLTVVTLGLTAISGSVLAQDDNQRRNPLADLDTDGDGSVSFSEFQAADNRRFSNADQDGDGLISLNELLAARPPAPPRDREIDKERLDALKSRMEKRITSQFEEMDTDGDGQLSDLEMQEYSFLRLDRDNNGLISGAELRPRRRGGPEFAGRRGQMSGQGRREGGRRGESGDQ